MLGRILLLFLALSLASPAFAAGQHGKTFKVVESEGSAVITAGDFVGAKEEAIADAKRRALENVLGTIIDSQSLVANGELVYDFIASKTKGYVIAQDILSEKKDLSRGVYNVRIKAVVSLNENLFDDLRSLSNCKSVIVQFDEDFLGKKSSSSIIKEKLISYLTEAGYNIIDLENVLQNDEGLSIFANGANGKGYLKKLRLKYLSDILIKGSSNTYFSSNNLGYAKSCRTDAHARVVDTRTSRIICEPMVTSVKGFGETEERAGRESVKKAADSLVAEFKKSQCLICEKRSILVSVSGVSDYSSYRRLWNLLEGLRFVESITSGSFKNGRAVFKLVFSEKPHFLCTRLDRLGYTVSESSTDRIEAAADGAR